MWWKNTFYTLLENAQFMHRLQFAFHNPFWLLDGYPCNHGYCELDTIFIQYICIGVYNGILYTRLHGLSTLSSKLYSIVKIIYYYKIKKCHSRGFFFKQTDCILIFLNQVLDIGIPRYMIYWNNKWVSIYFGDDNISR